MPCGSSSSVRVLLVRLFLLERNPWHRTARRSEPLEGEARIPATAWPAGSLKVSACSMPGIVAEFQAER